MQMISINCQRSYRKQALIEYLIRASKDTIILLQECTYEILSKFSDSHHLVFSKESKQIDTSGVALLIPRHIRIEQTLVINFERQVTPKHTYSFGAVGAITEGIVILSVHMPAYFQIIKRRKYFNKILESIENYKNTTIIIGGDWNSFFPYEKYFLKKLLSKDMHIYLPLKNTYDGKYIEPGLFWNNVLKVIGSFIPLRFKHDFFISNKPLNVSVDEVTEMISDHKPIKISV